MEEFEKLLKTLNVSPFTYIPINKLSSKNEDESKSSYIRSISQIDYLQFEVCTSFLRSQIFDEEQYKRRSKMSGKELIISFAQCMKSRKEVILIYTWPALVALFLASIGLPSLVNTLLLISAVTLVGLGVYFYNDINDFEDDIKIARLGNQMKGRAREMDGDR